MITDLTVLSSRRSYEFRPDRIRLSLLTHQRLHQALREAFGFQVVQNGVPMATFGPVAPTIPPGLVCDFGFYTSADGALTPIRFLHFEQARVVIDISGPSSRLDAVFQRVREVLQPFFTPEGPALLGEPTATREWSELTFQASLDPDGFLHPGIREASLPLAQSLGGDDRVLTPTLIVRWHRKDEPYAGAFGNATNPSEVFQLELRSGLKPEDRNYFSAAPLDSDAHVSFLTRLLPSLS